MLQHNSDGTQVLTQRFADHAAPAAGGFHGIDVREIARILRRHVNVIAATTAVLIALALVFVAVVTPLYSATSTVLIDPRRSSVVDNNNPVLSNF